MEEQRPKNLSTQARDAMRLKHDFLHSYDVSGFVSSTTFR